MAEQFDPYHMWLSIPREEQPPHHYRLLGLSLFEDHAESIAAAADRQMGHLRNYQSGKHAAASQRLLNEVAAARVCLLSPEKKAVYDRQLRERLGAEQATPSMLAAAAAEPRIHIDPVAPAGGRRRRTASRRTPRRKLTERASLAILGILAVGLVVALLADWAMRKPEQEAAQRSQKPFEEKAAKPARDRNQHPTRRAQKAVRGVADSKPEEDRREPTSDPPTEAKNPASPIQSAVARRREEIKRHGLETPAAAGEPPLAIAPFDEEEAKKHQLQWSRHLCQPAKCENSIGMKFVLIPPGEFDMGSTAEEVFRLTEEGNRDEAPTWYMLRLPDETPQHRVRITRPFWLGLTEVTQAQYEQVMRANPSLFKGDPNRPVEQVSWSEGAEFCRRLSDLPEEKTAGRRYALPTEAQWEYAARAGSRGRRWCSAAPHGVPEAGAEASLARCAWYVANSEEKTHPVGRLRPNPWGLHDVYGNVWEWCQDWHDAGYYATAPATDPTGPEAGTERVLRGGGWINLAGGCRSAYRAGLKPNQRYSRLGFRVACAVDAPGE